MPAFRYKSNKNVLSQTQAWQQRYAMLRNLADERGVLGKAEPDLRSEGERGFFTRFIDFVSKGEYAVAGAAEEIYKAVSGQEPDGLKAITHIPSRVLAEVFGREVGGVKAQRETFGDVAEEIGIPDKKLSDVFGGDNWFAQHGIDPGVRGTIALAASIFLDPTTYMTFGTADGMKVLGRAGATRFLNKKGMALFEAKYMERLGGVARSLGH